MGFEQENLRIEEDTVPEDFRCSICTCVAERAVKLPTCHHVFCQGCILDWAKKKTHCPHDQRPFELRDVQELDPFVNRVISKFAAKCSISGCAWIGELGAVREHELHCDFQTVACPNQGCTYRGPRKSLTVHLQEQCLFRIVSCEFCSQKLSATDLERHHKDACPEFPLDCPQGCSQKPRRSKLKQHLDDECENTQVSCPHSAFGCTFSGTRIQLRDQHLTPGGHEACQFVKMSKFLIMLQRHDEQIFKLDQELNQERISRKKLEFILKYMRIGMEMEPGPNNQMIPVTSGTDQAMAEVDERGRGYRVKYLRIRRNLTRLGTVNQVMPRLVFASRTIPTSMSLFYFEMCIINSGETGIVGIGVVPKINDMNVCQMPGWHAGYGYHGDDGAKFSFISNGRGGMYGPTFKTGDVVGCGLDRDKWEIFFTKNGSFLGVAFNNVRPDPNYCPVVGFRSHGAEVTVNFGQWEFQYDLGHWLLSK